MEYFSTDYVSPLGKFMLASDGVNLVGLWLEGQKYYGATVDGRLTRKSDLQIFVDAGKWLDAYFSGERPSPFLLPLAPAGTAFRKEVWHILCGIPYGEVITYGDIARKMAVKLGKKSMSSQAVGGAVGRNPLSIIIPCHRVVGSDGSLTGYAGGLEAKLQLLALEGVDVSRFFVPKKGTAL